MIRGRTIVLGLVCLVSWSAAYAGDPATPAKPRDWKEVAKEAKLEPALIERLERDRLAIAGPNYTQVFIPYVASSFPFFDSALPFFVTSDSLLAAYHGLLEESVLRLERVHAARLPDALRFLWGGLAGEPASSPAWRTAEVRARLVVGTALRLLGGGTPGVSAETKALLDEQVARIEAGTGTGKPTWLGPADDGFLTLDYGRFRPRGFYDRTDGLRRYFRAVSWLQSVPFRIEREDELRAFLRIATALESDSDQTARAAAQKALEAYDDLLGPGDDVSLVTLLRGRLTRQAWGDLDNRWSDLALTRRELFALGKERGGTQIQGSAATPGEPRQPSLRILSAARTPDAVLFQRILDAEGQPSGLAVAAALGSRWAREILAGDAKTKQALDASTTFAAGKSLYAETLRCVSAVLAEPEPGAPDFMRGEAWARKSVQTALSSWAQLRHTWVLQAKENQDYRCACGAEPGYVEETPEFFARLGRLADPSLLLFGRSGAFDPALVRVVLAEEIEEYVAARRGEGNQARLPALEDKFHCRCEAVGWSPETGAGGRTDWERFARDLRDPDAVLSPGAKEFLGHAGTELEGRWKDLELVCLRLEVLAHKELRGVEPTEPDRDFIRDYGKTLAALLFYDGNAYLSARDDAPRVVDVVSRLDPDGATYLEVATARPRTIYVLHPSAAGPVLCRGAVVPYYEFDATQPMTDDEWRARLDGKAPAPPAWVRPILHSEETTLPVERR